MFCPKCHMGSPTWKPPKSPTGVLSCPGCGFRQEGNNKFLESWKPQPRVGTKISKEEKAMEDQKVDGSSSAAYKMHPYASKTEVMMGRMKGIPPKPHGVR